MVSLPSPARAGSPVQGREEDRKGRSKPFWKSGVIPQPAGKGLSRRRARMKIRQGNSIPDCILWAMSNHCMWRSEYLYCPPPRFGATLRYIAGRCPDGRFSRRQDLKNDRPSYSGPLKICAFRSRIGGADMNVRIDGGVGDYDRSGVDPAQPYVVLRTVAWSAAHDVGLYGAGRSALACAVERLSAHGRVLISSEDPLPEDLVAYRNPVSADRMHDLLAYARLYVGEGGTMAAESAVLGTPAVFCNPSARATCEPWSTATTCCAASTRWPRASTSPGNCWPARTLPTAGGPTPDDYGRNRRTSPISSIARSSRLLRPDPGFALAEPGPPAGRSVRDTTPRGPRAFAPG